MKVKIGAMELSAWIMNVFVHWIVSRAGCVEVMFANYYSHCDAASSACAYSSRFIQFNP